MILQILRSLALGPENHFFVTGSDLVAWLQAKLHIVDTQVCPLADTAAGVSDLCFLSYKSRIIILMN